GRAAERAPAQRGDGERAGRFLLARSDRVFEVDDRLVGGERGCFLEHPLARVRNGQAGTARAGGHARTLTVPYEERVPAGLERRSFPWGGLELFHELPRGRVVRVRD